MRVEDNADNASRCLCPDCPTYDSCMGRADEKLYCGHARSDCDPTQRRCVCPDCPVWADHSLAATYFCTEGAAE
jgi:hypothetical protein